MDVGYSTVTGYFITRTWDSWLYSFVHVRLSVNIVQFSTTAVTQSTKSNPALNSVNDVARQAWCRCATTKDRDVWCGVMNDPLRGRWEYTLIN